MGVSVSSLASDLGPWRKFRIRGNDFLNVGGLDGGGWGACGERSL